MHKSLFRKHLALGIVFFCGATFASSMAVFASQDVAQRTKGNTLIAQSTVDEKSNLKFESRGCRRTKPTQVNCDVLITNTGNERQSLKFTAEFDYMQKTKAIDSSGTVYPVQIVQSGADVSRVGVSNGWACNCFTVSLAPSIPTKVTFTFEIPQDVTDLAALDLGYDGGSNNRTAISNIGTITSQSNSAPPRKKVR